MCSLKLLPAKYYNCITFVSVRLSHSVSLSRPLNSLSHSLNCLSHSVSLSLSFLTLSLSLKFLSSSLSIYNNYYRQTGVKYMLLKDEEGRKKEASKVIQTTKQSNTTHPRQSFFQRAASGGKFEPSTLHTHCMYVYHKGVPLPHMHDNYTSIALPTVLTNRALNSTYHL